MEQGNNRTIQRIEKSQLSGSYLKRLLILIASIAFISLDVNSKSKILTFSSCLFLFKDLTNGITPV